MGSNRKSRNKPKKSANRRLTTSGFESQKRVLNTWKCETPRQNKPFQRLQSLLTRPKPPRKQKNWQQANDGGLTRRFSYANYLTGCLFIRNRTECPGKPPKFQ